MKRAGIVLLALGLASCADFRTFRCPHCTYATHAKEPGESLCQSCLRSNVWSVCPACGFEEAQPGPGPFRCGSCRTQAYATTCRRCSKTSFSLRPETLCAACDRPAVPVRDAAAALKKSGRAHAERGSWEAAIDDFDAALRLEPRDTAARYALACVLARAGRSERALDELERSMDDGFSNGVLLRKDPDLASLRPHPRWRRLMERAPD